MGKLICIGTLLFGLIGCSSNEPIHSSTQIIHSNKISSRDEAIMNDDKELIYHLKYEFVYNGKKHIFESYEKQHACFSTAITDEPKTLIFTEYMFVEEKDTYEVLKIKSLHENRFFMHPYGMKEYVDIENGALFTFKDEPLEIEHITAKLCPANEQPLEYQQAKLLQKKYPRPKDADKHWQREY
jgi:hypothetical protein